MKESDIKKEIELTNLYTPVGEFQQEELRGSSLNIDKTMQDSLNRENQTEDKTNEERSLALFFAFDIVNSTKAKEIGSDNWVHVLNSILETVKKKIDKLPDPYELWRIQGDSIIFTININSKDIIKDEIRNMYRILQDVKKDIKSGNIESLTDNEKSSHKFLLEEILSIQAFAWICIVSDGQIFKSNYPYDNYVIKKNVNGEQSFVDFLGNDIDTGFRIGKYTRDGQLSLSFELAYYLHQILTHDDKAKLYLITYKKLKGVWNDHYYPIIWYYNKLDSKMPKTLEKTFKYDDYDKNDLIKEYYDNMNAESELSKKIYKKHHGKNIMFSCKNKMFKKLIRDLHLEDKIKEMDVLFNSYPTHSILNSEIPQLHCAVVCYVQEDNGPIKIMIGKRGRAKKLAYQKWEFGCAKANVKESLVDEIEKEYKEDFGIDIELIMDNGRSDQQPYPFAVYSIHKGKKNITQFGMIFAARITSVEELKTRIHENGFIKHSKVRLLSENELDALNDKDCVPDFKNTVHKVIDYLKNQN